MSVPRVQGGDPLLGAAGGAGGGLAGELCVRPQEEKTATGQAERGGECPMKTEGALVSMRVWTGSILTRETGRKGQAGGNLVGRSSRED